LKELANDESRNKQRIGLLQGINDENYNQMQKNCYVNCYNDRNEQRSISRNGGKRSKCSAILWDIVGRLQNRGEKLMQQ